MIIYLDHTCKTLKLIMFGLLPLTLIFHCLSVFYNDWHVEKTTKEEKIFREFDQTIETRTVIMEYYYGLFKECYKSDCSDIDPFPSKNLAFIHIFFIPIFNSLFLFNYFY